MLLPRSWVNVLVWTLAWACMVTSQWEGRPSLTFAMRKLAFATNQFGLDLHRALRLPVNHGAAFCPFCVATSLAQVLLGARGRTASALQQTLYLWGVRSEDVHLAFHDLLRHLRDITLQHRDEEFQLLLVHNVYIQRDYSVLYPYHKFLHVFYNTTVHPLDFGMYGEESRQHINALVERNTDGRVRNILPRPLPKTTSVLLLSALAFEGELDFTGDALLPSEAFHRNPSSFYILNHAFQSTHSRLPPDSYAAAFAQPYSGGGSNALVAPAPTRARQGALRYGAYEYLDCVAAEVPFRDRRLSLLLLAPAEGSGLPLLETRLNAQHIADILATMQHKQLSLEMPVLSVDDSLTNLTQALFRSGLVDLFTPGFAELLGMSDFRWLHITNLIHKVNLNVKKPTKLVGPSSGREILHLNLAEKPFLFFIMDNISGLAIAMGKMVTGRRS